LIVIVPYLAKYVYPYQAKDKRKKITSLKVASDF